MSKQRWIEVSLASQTLRVLSGHGVIKEYPVSTAKNGAGEIMDSECTPRGKHMVAEMIGADCPINTVFVGRRATGELYKPSLRDQYPERDWILTRIIRLRGTEPGINQGGDVDSYDRYIYFHGTPDDVDIHSPGSHGCIRLRNQDIVELFDQVEEGTEVIITAD